MSCRRKVRCAVGQRTPLRLVRGMHRVVFFWRALRRLGCCSTGGFLRDASRQGQLSMVEVHLDTAIQVFDLHLAGELLPVQSIGNVPRGRLSHRLWDLAPSQHFADFDDLFIRREFRNWFEGVGDTRLGIVFSVFQAHGRDFDFAHGFGGDIKETATTESTATTTETAAAAEASSSSAKAASEGLVATTATTESPAAQAATTESPAAQTATTPTELSQDGYADKGFGHRNAQGFFGMVLDDDRRSRGVFGIDVDFDEPGIDGRE